VCSSGVIFALALTIRHKTPIYWVMNRREFLTTATAAAAIPALPAIPMPAATPEAIPNAARFWAVYLANLHGDVSPGMLAKATGLSTARATAIRTDLIASKVLKPRLIVAQPLAAKTVVPEKLVKTAQKTLDLLAEENAEPELSEDGSEDV